jgi:glycosyltransferase involved in cell wall biosynthesis
VRVCFLRPGSGPVEHAEALRGAGAEVVEAEAAPEGGFDVVIACGWRTAGEAFRVEAARRAMLVPVLEHRALAPERPERLAAVVALDLPFELLVTSAWLDDAVGEQHPHARRRRVPLGRRELAFSESGDGDAPLRVAGAPPELLARCQAPVEAAVDGGGVDVVVSLDAPLVENLAALEPPRSPLSAILDGFAVGATCVAVPTEGRDELVEHRVNGLIVDPDDVAGAAAALDTLATRVDTLSELQSCARETVKAWPDWGEAGRGMLSVLEELLADEVSYDAAWPAALMADAVAEAVKLSAHESARTDAMYTAIRRLESRPGARAPGAPSQVDRLRARLRGGRS